MAVSKIAFDGRTLIDLTNDTATEASVESGKTFHKADGTIGTGTASVVHKQAVLENAYKQTIPGDGAYYVDLKMIGGKSVKWNQLFKTPLNATSYIDITYDGVITITSRTNSTERKAANLQPITNGHKYLYRCHIDNSGNSTVAAIGFYRASDDLDARDTYAAGYVGTAENILKATNAEYFSLRVSSSAPLNAAAKFGDFILIDLTAIYGSGNEPTSVDDERIAYLKEYAERHPEYDEGSIVNAVVTEVTAEGENIWDEQWENGTFSTSTGVNISNVSQIRSKNLISILPNQEYTFVVPKGTAWIMFYDDNGQIVSPLNPQSGKCISVAGDSTGRSNFVTPNNASYMKFYMTITYGATYSHNLAIFEGSTPRPYVPYREPTSFPIPEAVRILPDYGAGIGDVYNEIDIEDGKYYKRVGSLDLGTLTWAYNGVRFVAQLPNITEQISNRHKGIVEKYMPYYADVASAPDKSAIFGGAQDHQLYIKDSAYSDITSFRNAVSGLKVYYILQSEQVNDITPYFPGTFLNVDAASTVTYENDAKLEIPTSTEYLVKGSASTPVAYEPEGEETKDEYLED